MPAPPEGAEPSAPRRLRVPEGAPFYAAVAGLAAFYLFLLPFDASDLCYLQSLEDGHWVMQELVHPLWVPWLRVYRWLLRGLGWRGLILVPIEVLNVAFVTATLVLLFRLARRITGDTFASSASVLMMAGSIGLGRAAMRPTPYAPAFLCLVGSLSLLVADRRPSLARHAAAGVLAGLSMSLHASAMALAPTAIACVALDPERRPRRDMAARAAAFGLAMAATAGACWTTWCMMNGVGASLFGIEGIRSSFPGVEQVSGTSIYTSGSAWRQIAGFSSEILVQGFLVVVLGVPATIAEVHRARALPRDATPPLERRLLVATIAAFAMVAGFFVVNNTRNGFIFSSLALVPVVVARATSRRRWARRALAAGAVLCIVHGVHFELRFGENRFNDPLPREVRFVEAALGPRSVLLFPGPGCVFSEVRLLSSLNVWRVDLAPADTRQPCDAPRAEIGEALRARVKAWRAQRVTVFYAFGDEDTDFAGDVSGGEKSRQIFFSPTAAARERGPHLRAVRSAMLAAGLALGEPIVSPNGARYAEVTVDGDPVPPPP